jgi:hypothetical protein
MKRLRKSNPGSKLRYYIVGEYGTKTNRPHYHALIFNIGDISTVDRAWTHGLVHVGSVNSASIAYTTKYIDKEKRIPVHKNDDRLPEFSLMSKGLGKSYLTPAMKRYHQNDINRMYVTNPDGTKVTLPRYYRDQIYTEAEKKDQVRLIQKIVEDKDEQERMEFGRMYGRLDGSDSGISFEEWKSSKRYQRYREFYSNKSQNRDKI